MRRLLLVLFLSATCIAQTNSTPAILTNNEEERYDLKFGTAVMKVTSVQTGGTWSMVDFTASPGAQTMLHRHPSGATTCTVARRQAGRTQKSRPYNLGHRTSTLACYLVRPTITL
jgi:hypothetical protein